MPTKKKAKKVAAKKKPSSRRQKDEIDLLIHEINKELSGGGGVYRGADIRYLSWERITSGSLGLDILMGGGLPQGAITQYKGEESVAKTTMALHACAAAQERGEHVAWSASEGFGKVWARRNGCYIPYSDTELERLVSIGKFRSMSAAEERATEYAEAHSGWGDFVLVQTRSGPRILEVTSKLVRSGKFSVAVLDSAGAILPEEDDDRDIGDDQRVGGNSKIIGHFVNKVRKSFNSGLETDNGIVPNKTSVIVINQVRAQIGAPSYKGMKPQPEAGGGYALRHGKDIDIRFSRGELLQESVNRKKLIYGRVVKAKCEKNRTAPPYLTASWSLFFKDHPNETTIQAGVVDVPGEAFFWGVYYGLIEQSGAWYVLDDEKYHGADNAVVALRSEPERALGLCREIWRLQAGRSEATIEVPSVGSAGVVYREGARGPEAARER